MKLIALSIVASFALTTVACGKKAEPAPEPEKKPEAKPVEPAPAPGAETRPGEIRPVEAKPATPSALPTACQKYLDKVRECAGAMPEAARGQFVDALRRTEEAWALVPKDQIESSCKMAWDAAKQGMAAACVNVKWE